jgi:hypothetical protein
LVLTVWSLITQLLSVERLRHCYQTATGRAANHVSDPLGCLLELLGHRIRVTKRMIQMLGVQPLIAAIRA